MSKHTTCACDCTLLRIILLIVVSLSLLFGAGLISAMAQAGFLVAPTVTDDTTKDNNIISPNIPGDGIKDRALIVFTRHDSPGDYRIIIDVHGAGGAGPPDGSFRPVDDWVAPADPGGRMQTQRIATFWDGTDKDGNPIPDGTYKIRVEIDYQQNGVIDSNVQSYAKEVLTVVVDTTAPSILLSGTPSPFSPNGDKKKDTTEFAYVLQEELSILEFSISQVPLLPQITLSKVLGVHTGIWDGKDQLGNVQKDDIYNCKLVGTDLGGNTGEIAFEVQIDTEPPRIISTNPSNNSIYNTSIATIGAVLDDTGGSAIDYGREFTKIELLGPGSPSGVLSEDKPAQQLTFTLNQPLETIAQNGKYTIVVNVSDSAGNSAAEKRATFMFDTQRPTITVKVGGTTLRVENPNIRVTADSGTIEIVATDNVSDVNFTPLPSLDLSDPLGQPVAIALPALEGNTIRSSYAGLAEDGTYTLNIGSLSDKAGNTLSAQSYRFRYIVGVVVEEPEVVSIIPEDGAFVKDVDDVEVQLRDNSGQGVDFTTDRTYIVVRDKDKNKVPGNLSSVGESTLKWEISEPLPRDGSRDGLYTVEVYVSDKAGNSIQAERTFTFDSQIPRIEKTEPAEVQTDELKSVTVKLYDELSGVDLTDTQVRLLDKNGVSIGASKTATKEAEGLYAITLKLFSERKKDGSDDGKYTIEITPEDRAGNRSNTAFGYTFIFVTQPPEIVSITPEDKTFVNQVNTVAVQLSDYSGIGIDFEESKIDVADKKGQKVNGKLNNDGNLLLTWQIDKPLSRDGSADGEYTITVNVVNKAGKADKKMYNFTFDSQVPRVISWTPPPDTIVSESLNSVEVKLQDEISGVDFANTQVLLKAPDGSPVGATPTDDGKDTITLTFDARNTDGSDDGIYAIEVTPADRAGNIAGNVSRSEFVYNTRRPEIVSIIPEDNDFVNQVKTVTAQLLDHSGEGVDFANSMILVYNPNNFPVPGELSHEDNLFIWTISTPLLVDGTQDGLYTIIITIVDNNGNRTTQTSSFTYATKEPEIISITPADGAPVNQLSTIEVDLLDHSGAGIDFETILTAEKSTIVVADAQGNEVPGKLNNDSSARLAWEIDKPLPRDSKADGEYTITVTVFDNAGNKTEQDSHFTFDTQIPIITGTTPADGATVSSLSEIAVTLTDALSGVDFDGTQVLLKAPDFANIGTTKTDDGKTTITLNFNKRKTDGSDDGVYVIEVIPADRAGNVAGSAFEYRFTLAGFYDVSITPEDNAFVHELNMIEMLLSDQSSAEIDFGKSTISVRNPNGHIVPGEISSVGNILRWQIATPLLTDGTQDGLYTIDFRVVDKAGNIATKTTKAIYVTELPEIVLITPDDGALVNQLSTVEANLIDHSGAGIDFEAILTAEESTIVVTDAQGKEISGRLSDDGVSQMIWTIDKPLPRDGSKDGEYTITATAYDKAGNVSVDTSTFIFDTQVPEVAKTTPAKDAKVSRLGTVEVQLTDDISDVDFVNTQVRLLSPTGATIGATKTDDGVSAITLTFDARKTDGSEDGVYVIEVTPADRAGNITGSAYRYEFVLATELPEIESITLEDEAVVNQVNIIDVQLLDHSGEGVDFEKTQIVVTNPEDKIVPGKLSDDDSLHLIWEIAAPLSRDGSDDGVYTVAVTVVDNAGTSNSYTQTFLFDSQVPTVVSTRPARNERVFGLDIVLNSIEVKLSDAVTPPLSKGTGGIFSGVDLAGTEVRLLKSDGVVIGTTKTDDGADTITLSFDALKDDGSDDGVYTIEITPVDFAGNQAGSASKIEFFYVTLLPELVSATPSELSYVNQINRIDVTVADHSGKGIDFDNSTITLLDPHSNIVDGRQFDNDNNQIWFELTALLPTDGTVDGEYSVLLNIVDKVGSKMSEEDGTYKFTYDSQPPSIESQEPEDKAILENNIATITFKVVDSEGSGVNFSASTVQLNGPSGTVNGQQSDDGISQITFDIPSKLPQAGKYTIEVILVDRAGNSTVPLESTFDYPIDPPRVIAIIPPNKSKLNAITEIRAQLEEYSGTGLDVSSTGSNIQVFYNGNEVDGTLDYEGSELIFTLAPLLTDGTDDGSYTILVTPVDNTGTTGTQKSSMFTYDTQEPDIISVTNIDMTANVSLVNGEVERIEVVMQDVSDAGVDFEEEKSPEKSTVVLKDKDGNVVDGEQGDDDNNTMWWQLTNPLQRGGDADGMYTIEVKALDEAGNIEEETFTLLYDTQVPTIISTTPEEGTAVDIPIERISVTLEDLGSGIDLIASNVQLIGPAGVPLSSNKGDNGKDTIHLNFKALKEDGADDGRYRIEVIPADKAGNAYQSPVVYEFFYITQKPEVVSTSPEEKTIVNQLNQVTAVLEDRSGEGIDLDLSTIRLIALNGIEVPGRQTDDDQNTIYWILERPLPTDGTADGEYIIDVTAADKAGSTAIHQPKFMYDSMIPKVTQITPADKTVLYQSFTEIVIVLTDVNGSGVDFAGTVVRLVSPDGDIIGGNKTDNGVDTITVTIPTLTEEGTYIIEVTPKDLSGNISAHALQYKFSLILTPPIVKSVTASGQTLPEEFINELTEVTAELEDKSGVGLELTEVGSRIWVIGPKGEVVGEQKSEGDNTIIWTPIRPLSTDGSDDGDYTIRVVPVNTAGRSGSEAQYNFMYDTVAPEVDVDSIQLKLVEAASRNSLGEITVRVADEAPSSSIDWDNIDESWVQLKDDTGAVIPGIISSEETEALASKLPGILTLKLEAPLASDGSQDGEYTVVISPRDQAGNVTEAVEYNFFYDTNPPDIDVTSLTISDPQQPDIELKPFVIDPNDIDYPTSINAQNGVMITVKITDTDDGLGVDLAQSNITVEQPGGSVLQGNLKHNGVDTIQLTTGMLRQEGFYRVAITAVGLDRDKIGINPTESISASFLFETTKPVAQLTEYGGKKTLENQEAKLRGIAEDRGTENVPASGVAKVEVGYEDADGNYIWFLAEDESTEEEDPWSQWLLEFLPSTSGEYELEIRVTDEAGNAEIYKGVTLNFSVTLMYKGEAYVWPNPISHSRGDVANFSFEINADNPLRVTLSIYDIAGYLVYQNEFAGVSPTRELANVQWKAKNQYGDKVASGIYIFQLEADDGDKKANMVGKILVVQ